MMSRSCFVGGFLPCSAVAQRTTFDVEWSTLFAKLKKDLYKCCCINYYSCLLFCSIISYAFIDVTNHI